MNTHMLMPHYLLGNNRNKHNEAMNYRNVLQNILSTLGQVQIKQIIEEFSRYMLILTALISLLQQY